ncbi:MAG TPA: hypothetical protein VFI49_08125 [Rudaea sp.]|nr:hypothetical protein [Rudaea sp.]
MNNFTGRPKGATERARAKLRDLTALNQEAMASRRALGERIKANEKYVKEIELEIAPDVDWLERFATRGATNHRDDVQRQPARQALVAARQEEIAGLILERRRLELEKIEAEEVVAGFDAPLIRVMNHIGTRPDHIGGVA